MEKHGLYTDLELRRTEARNDIVRHYLFFSPYNWNSAVWDWYKRKNAQEN